MRTKLIVLALLTALLLAGILLFRSLAPEAPPAPRGHGKFIVVDAAERALDGAPALSLTFSHPLDRRVNYDKSIEMFEMPPRLDEHRQRSDDSPSQKPDEQDRGAKRQRAPAVSTAAADTELRGGNRISRAWVVGDNPRLLYFPHVKPQTRYVVRVQPGLQAAGGAALDAEARYSVRTEAVSPAFYFAARGMVLPARQNGGLPIVTVNVPEVDIQFLRVRPGQLSRFLDRVIAPARCHAPRFMPCATHGLAVARNGAADLARPSPAGRAAPRVLRDGRRRLARGTGVRARRGASRRGGALAGTAGAVARSGAARKRPPAAMAARMPTASNWRQRAQDRRRG